MKKKNSGFTASGLSRPEIRPGDIFRDTRRGGRVVIRHVTLGNITYRREAYEYDCVMPRRQFDRDFIVVETNNRQWRDVQPRILKKSGQCWLREVRSEKRTESKISAEG